MMLKAAGLLFMTMMVAASGAVSPIISEFMAINDTVHTNALGECSDWIEIYNGATGAVDLVGWHLLDSNSDWTFPSNSPALTTLDAGEHAENRNYRPPDRHGSMQASPDA